MIKYMHHFYVFILYTLFFCLYSLSLPKDALTEEIYTDLFLFSIIILLHFFYMKKSGSLAFMINRYDSLDELCYGIYLQDLKRSLTMMIGMLILTLCFFNIYNFRYDILTTVLVFLNIFIIFGFINFGNIIDIVFDHKIKWKLLLSIYVIFSFMIYGYISNISLFCFFDITYAYHNIGSQLSFLKYINLIIYYIVIIVSTNFIINKKRENLL